MVTSVKSSTGTAAETHSVVLIARLARSVKHRMEQALAPLGLRMRHVVALSYLRDHGATPQGALGDGLRIDASNLVGLLNELDDMGLVIRRRDPADRRRHIVDLAPKGRKLIEHDVQRSLAAVDDAVLGALSPDDRDALHRILLQVAGELAAECLGPEEGGC
jgi:DNA-binding MarR family transcriptional regulator